jgi:hypothetical protein
MLNGESGEHIREAYLEKAAIVFLKSFSLLSKSVPICKSMAQLIARG